MWGLGAAGKNWASQVVLVIKNLPASAKDAGSIPGLEDPLEHEMATHSSIAAWELPWTEEPARATVYSGRKESDMT